MPTMLSLSCTRTTNDGQQAILAGVVCGNRLVSLTTTFPPVVRWLEIAQLQMASRTHSSRGRGGGCWTIPSATVWQVFTAGCDLRLRQLQGLGLELLHIGVVVAGKDSWGWSEQRSMRGRVGHPVPHMIAIGSLERRVLEVDGRERERMCSGRRAAEEGCVGLRRVLRGERESGQG